MLGSVLLNMKVIWHKEVSFDGLPSSRLQPSVDMSTKSGAWSRRLWC